MTAEPGLRGFSLLELILAAAFGTVVFALALQLLIGGSLQSGSLAKRLQLRRLQRRTLQLLQADLAGARSWQLSPQPGPDWPCSMAGRQPLIAITPLAMRPDQEAPAVVYSLGPAPSGIWRGTVLMRCGPAFDLHGQPRLDGRYQNRVVLDRIDAARLDQDPVLPLVRLRLEQRIPGSDQPVISSAVG